MWSIGSKTYWRCIHFPIFKINMSNLRWTDSVHLRMRVVVILVSNVEFWDSFAGVQWHVIFSLVSE